MQERVHRLDWLLLYKDLSTQFFNRHFFSATGFLETLEARFIHQEERDSHTFGDIEVSWTVQGSGSLLKQFSIIWFSSEDRVIQTKYVGPEKRRCTIPVKHLKWANFFWKLNLLDFYHTPLHAFPSPTYRKWSLCISWVFNRILCVSVYTHFIYFSYVLFFCA